MGYSDFGQGHGYTAHVGRLDMPTELRRTWTVQPSADRAYYDWVRAGGIDGEDIAFPLDHPGTEFCLEGEQVFIGRGRAIRGGAQRIELTGLLADPCVSQVHAALVNSERGWSIVDLGSTNGTLVNGRRIDPVPVGRPIPLKPGDRINLGAWTALIVRLRVGAELV